MFFSRIVLHYNQPPGWRKKISTHAHTYIVSLASQKKTTDLEINVLKIN